MSLNAPARPLSSYLPHSVVATVAMLATPLLLLWVCTEAAGLNMLAAIVVTLALAFIGTAVAAHLWDERSGGRDISFSELMVWSWYRLARADKKLIDTSARAETIAATPEEQMATLCELNEALESKDPYTRGHSARVERIAFNIAVAMGLPLKEIEVMRKAAALHDVGKLRIPNRILHKPGRLDDQERAEIEEHPVVGSWMVASLGDPRIVETVRHHHERWDGMGYPDRIAETEIPLFSRIIAVADTFDALTSTRSYRAGSNRARAIEIVKTEAGSQFDPTVVEAFLTTLPAKSPAVAGLLIAAPAFLWRQFASWAKRFANGATAPALGAVGAAVVLGTSTFAGTPPAPARTPAPSVPQIAAVNDDTGAPQANELADGDTRDRVLGVRIERKRAEAKTASQRRDGRAQERARDADKRQSDRDTASTSTPGVARNAAAPGTSKPSAPTQPSAPAVSAPSAPVAPATLDAEKVGPAPHADLDDIEDPKGNIGQDCSNKGAASKGSELHCN